MSKIVFFTWPGGGNQPPAIGLAQHLRRRDHQIAFAGYAGQVERFAAAGFDLAPMPGCGQGWGPVDPSKVMELLTDRVWACPDHVLDVRTVLEREQPDLIVVDCLMASVLAVLERLAAREQLAVPTLVLVHSAPGALAPPGGAMDYLVVNPLNRLRSHQGLDPVDTLWAAWQPHTVVCASIPELDPLAQQVPATFTWLGPIFETPAPDDPSARTWVPEAGEPPLVLVSFSSGTAWDQTSRIQRTIDGLAGADVRLFVTSGAVDPARLRLPPNSPEAGRHTAVTVVPYLEHSAVLPHVAAVVTHAGHGTLAAALAHGLPVVTIPNLAADQPALSAQTAQLGAGVHLDEAAEPGDIRDAVLATLQLSSYRDAARKLAHRIDQYQQQLPTAVETTLTATAAH